MSSARTLNALIKNNHATKFSLPIKKILPFLEKNFSHMPSNLQTKLISLLGFFLTYTPTASYASKSDNVFMQDINHTSTYKLEFGADANESTWIQAAIDNCHGILTDISGNLNFELIADMGFSEQLWGADKDSPQGGPVIYHETLKLYRLHQDSILQEFEKCLEHPFSDNHHAPASLELILFLIISTLVMSYCFVKYGMGGCDNRNSRDVDHVYPEATSLLREQGATSYGSTRSRASLSTLPNNPLAVDSHQSPQYALSSASQPFFHQSNTVDVYADIVEMQEIKISDSPNNSPK